MKIKLLLISLFISSVSFGQGNFYDNKMALESTYSFSPVNNGTGLAGVTVHFKKNIEVGVSFLGTPGATGAGVGLGFHAKKDQKLFYPSVFVSFYDVSIRGGGSSIIFTGNGVLNYRVLNLETVKSEIFAGIGFASGIATNEHNTNASTSSVAFGIQAGIEIKKLTLRAGIGQSFSQSGNSVGSTTVSFGIGVLI